MSAESNATPTPYVSSMISRYGDVENVKKDAKACMEIMSRQGAQFLIDVIAESHGTFANKYKCNTVERQRLIDSTLADMKNALAERL